MTKNEGVAEALTEEILPCRFRSVQGLPSERNLVIRLVAIRSVVRVTMKMSSGSAGIQPGSALSKRMEQASVRVIGFMWQRIEQLIPGFADNNHLAALESKAIENSRRISKTPLPA